jgi:hypothetical protein
MPKKERQINAFTKISFVNFMSNCWKEEILILMKLVEEESA